jgi:hypothetical protein
MFVSMDGEEGGEASLSSIWLPSRWSGNWRLGMEERRCSGRRHLILRWRRFRIAVFYVHLVVGVSVSDGWDLAT